MKNAFKEKAIRLRKEGLSYNEILKQGVEASKSTLSLWLKDVPLKSVHKKRLYTKAVQNMARGAQSQKERRSREVNAIIEKARNEIECPISENAYKLFGVALYWAEGSKGNSFQITNSDPYMIIFMVQWFKKIFQVSPTTLKARLNMYSQQNEILLKKFWSELTEIPVENFGKSYIKPSNKGYKKNNLYYGTIQIYVPKGTDMKHTIYGWSRAVLQNLETTVNLTERKWISLRETPRPINLVEEKDGIDAPIA